MNQTTAPDWRRVLPQARPERPADASAVASEPPPEAPARHAAAEMKEIDELLRAPRLDHGRLGAVVHSLHAAVEAGPIELDAIDILPSEATGSVTIVAGPEKPEVVIIEAQFELRGRSYARKAAFPIAPGRS